MKATNYGNGYKFQAIMDRRSTKKTILVQRMKNDGTWGKPCEIPTFGKAPEQVIENLIENNNRQFRLAE